MNFPRNEVLLANNYKVIQHGYFTFLVFVNEDMVKELVYVYSIDVNENNVTCSKSSEKIYSISGNGRYLKNLNFKTTKNFKDTHNNTWREKYYSCFADDFLDITNDKKIDLLNKLSAK